MLFANRNGMFYVLDRVTGQFLSGKPFTKVTWMDGFDAKGRPNKVLSPSREGTVVFPNNQGANFGADNLGAMTSGPTNTRFTPGTAGAVQAFDPRTGERKWTFPMNDATDAGVLTTTTNVLFSGGREGYFYALDARDGKLLWRTQLGGQIANGPMSYQVNGRQYVTVAAGNAMFVFALKQ